MSKRQIKHQWLLNDLLRHTLRGATANLHNLPRDTYTEIGSTDTRKITTHQYLDGEIMEIIHDEFITK